MQIIDSVIMIGYFVLIFLIGILGARKATSSEEYAVAGRRLKLPMYTGCIIAVVLGGASTIGSTGLGYKFGISGAWLVVMMGLGLILIALFFVGKIIDLKVLTISEFLERRFNERAKEITAVVSSIYVLMVSATQIISLGTILQSILGWNTQLSMLIVGILIFIYTVLGGMWALSMTDFIHFIVITIGILFLLLPFSVAKAGGLSTLIQTVPDDYLSVTNIGWSTIFQYFLLYGLGIIIGQDIWQRVFTAKTEKVAKHGTILAGLYSMIYGLAVAIIGSCAFILLPNITNTQTVFSVAVVEFLPAGVTGIVLAAVVAALMSTASGTLLASATLIANDIVLPRMKKQGRTVSSLTLSRTVTALLGVVAIFLAIIVGNIIDALNIAYSVLTGTLFIPVLAAFFVKKIAEQAIIIAMCSSFIAVVGSIVVFTPDSILPILIGIGVNIIIVTGAMLKQPVTK